MVVKALLYNKVCATGNVSFPEWPHLSESEIGPAANPNGVKESVDRNDPFFCTKMLFPLDFIKTELFCF
jgi:hypothetical protein